MRLRPLPVDPAPTVRMLFAGDLAGLAVVRALLDAASSRLEAILLDEPARITARLATLPPLTPTVLVLTARDAPAGLAAGADPAVAPDHLVVLGAAAGPPVSCDPIHTRVTVVVGDDIDRAGPEIVAWCDAVPQVTVRVLPMPDAELVRPRSPVAALLIDLFAVNETYPSLR